MDAGDEPARYPDTLGMGYPFDKTWTQLLPTDSETPPPFPTIKSVVMSRKHMLTSKVKIFRTVDNYEPPSE